MARLATLRARARSSPVGATGAALGAPEGRPDRRGRKPFCPELPYPHSNTDRGAQSPRNHPSLREVASSLGGPLLVREPVPLGEPKYSRWGTRGNRRSPSRAPFEGFRALPLSAPLFGVKMAGLVEPAGWWVNATRPGVAGTWTLADLRSRRPQQIVLMELVDACRDRAIASSWAALEERSRWTFSSGRDFRSQCWPDGQNPTNPTDRWALAGRPGRIVDSVLGGEESPEPGLGLSVVLRELARHTARVRDELKSSASLREIVAGQIAELADDNLVLAMSGGGRTMVPTWLARGAPREHVGQFLALLQEKLDEHQALVEAMPAISLEPRNASQDELSPFGRDPRLYRVNAKDAAQLAREPQPLRILVPVTIEG